MNLPEIEFQIKCSLFGLIGICVVGILGLAVISFLLFYPLSN